MTYNEIENFVNGIKNNGEFSTKCITRTNPTWRATTNNPYVIIRKEGRKVVERIERVVKMTYYNNDAMIGGNYTNQVTNQIAKVGNDPKEWATEAMRGTTWVKFPYLMVSDKNPNQFYMRLTMRLNCKAPKVLYFLDGKLVTDPKVIEDIKSWQKPHTMSVKQNEHGIESENEIKPLNIKVENVVYLAQSGKELNKEVLELFKIYAHLD